MADEIDALVERVVVDAYGDDEQLWSFRQWFEDTTTFPFQATVVGAEVQIVDIDYDGDERRGLVARCTRDGREHSVSLLDVAPAACIPVDAATLLVAYRRWANADPLDRAR